MYESRLAMGFEKATVGILSFAMVLFVVTATQATAGPVFLGLGDLPGGVEESAASAVSADGTAVVGTSYSATGAEAFRWTLQTGMVGLGALPEVGQNPASFALGVSGDGSVIVGSFHSAFGGPQAFRWTATDGMQALGASPEGLVAQEATAVSGDGQVIVGTASLVTDQQAFRWTASNGVQLLGTMPGSGGDTSAADISDNGAVIVGAGGTSTGSGAFQWHEATGIQILEQLPGSQDSRAEAVNSTGDRIVGFRYDSGGNLQAIRWANGHETETLGDFTALGIADDGSVVVGTYNLDLPDSQAVIWDAMHGMRTLQDVLESVYGLEINGWKLQGATDISADGRVIVGTGVNPSGQTEAFMAIIPEPTTLLLLGISSVVLVWRFGVALAGD